MDRDPKRTGVKASLVPYGEPSTYYVDNRLHGPPGAFLDSTQMDGKNWILCCPGCGEAGSPRDGQSWQIVAGSFSDVEALASS